VRPFEQEGADDDTAMDVGAGNIVKDGRTALPIGAADPTSMTAAQRAVYDRISGGPRKDVPWPFLAMLDAPHLADAIQAVGGALRFSGTIPEALREVAILATAAAYGSGYEWDYHVAIARRLAVAEATIAAAQTGNLALADDALDRLTISVCRTAVLQHRVNPNELNDLIAHSSRAVASEIVAIAGYYPLLALFLSAAELDHPVR